MALHRRRHAAATARLFAAPAALGGALSVVLVGGLTALGDSRPDGPLLAIEHGLGAVMLILAFAGLFGCAAFGTGLSLAEEKEPRGGSGRALPVRLLPIRVAARTGWRHD
jgi:hypothetical protein